jgi:hypothetical protein
VKAAEQTTVAYGEGVLRIETSPATNRILGATGSLEVTVQMPAGPRIRAKAARAEFRGVGPLGDVAFEGAQGSVKIDEAETARLTLLAGDISVGHLGAPAEIRTQKGDIQIAEAVRGALELHTDQGEILVGAPTESLPVCTATPPTAGPTRRSRTPTTPQA